MRYKNWDVLMFPEKSKVPVQEFKAACHVVSDTTVDCAPVGNHMPVIPTMTCFVPALRQGQPFRMSIHSWESPEPSPFLKEYSRHADQVVFEAAVFIDGKKAGYRFFGRDGPWPVIIETSLSVDRNGEFELMTFPKFHQELLTQNYWNASDELGRIRVVISEGFPRESHNLPYERIKCVVAFSFQHAPLDVLEASSIAWPNPAMWRQVSYAAGALPTRSTIPRKSSEPGVDVHSHSPRRASGSRARSKLPPPHMGMMLPPTMPTVTRAPVYDPFTDERGPVWRQASTSSAGVSLDVSMPDYSSSSGMSQANHSRRGTDPVPPGKESRRYHSLQSHGAVDSLCEALKHVRDSRSASHENTSETRGAAVNTPRADDIAASENLSPWIMADLLTALAADESGIRVPPPTVRMTTASSEIGRDRKEGGTGAARGDENGATEPRRSLSGLTNSAGNKRQRVVSGPPLVIDLEEEPKNTPHQPLSDTESLSTMSTLVQEDKEN